MKTQEKLNMTMLCDFYELTMGNGYFQAGYKDPFCSRWLPRCGFGRIAC